MSSATTITWLGHATFVITGADGTRVLVDPFVSSNPSCPPEWREIDNLDVVAVTHGHLDHVADVVEVYQDGRPTTIVAIVELAHWLRQQGLPGDVVMEMNKGGTVRLPGVDITMTDANHSAGIPAGESMAYCGEPAGLIFRMADGTVVYHAGDTNVFGDMSLIGELYQPDIALLPIGDHYTMGPREAAKACELLGVSRVVPMHYGTFPVLVGTPDELRQELADRGLEVEVVALQPGESWP